MAITHLYFGLLATMLILAGCVAQPTTTPVDQTTDQPNISPTGDAMENKSGDTTEEKRSSITVSDQDYNDSVTIDSVTFDKPGFVVIHADSNGAFGEVIGNSELINGTATNLVVSVDAEKAAPRVHAMPHYDDNNDGAYGFPEDDAPVIVDGAVLVKAINWKEAGESMEDGESMETNSSDAETSVTEISITARQFEFQPSTISAKKGEALRLTVTSVDVTHGFAIPEFGVSATLTPGKTTIVEFTPDKTGEYTFFCNVFCGSGHSGMKGKLVVIE